MDTIDYEKFYKVQIYSNWGYFDRLGDYQLKTGDKLEVVWPDGFRDGLPVIIEETRSPHGMYDNGDPISKAFVEIDYHGAKARIRILDLYCRLMKRADEGNKGT